MKPLRLSHALLAATLMVTAASAQPTSRDELRRQRQVIEAEHDKRAEACRQQFVVTPCLDQVRADRQRALAKVQDQEVALGQEERQKRAQARERRLADKSQAAASQADPPLAERAASSTPTRSTPKTPRPRPVTPPPTERRAQEQQRREAFDARQREIQSHREEVERRNADRARRKSPRPLPSPASGAG